MITAVEDISSTKKRLRIEIPSDVIEKEYVDSIDRMRQKAKIPGFRQGKAPVSLIEKKFGKDIKVDIIDRLVPEYYSQALKEAELVPVALPEFEGSLDILKNEPLAFALTVEVRPNLRELNYAGLKIDDVTAEVEDREVDDTLGGLQEERALFEVVDRDIRENDLIVIDYVKLDPEGGKELSSAKDQVMDLGNKLTPSGLLEEIVGRKKGDVVEISLPGVEGGELREDSEKGNRLKITIKEVKEKKLPPLDDEFAKDIGHETLDVLRDKAREGILKAKRERNANRQKEKLLDMLLEAHEFDLPQSLLGKELEKLVINEKVSHKQSNELPGATGNPSVEEDSLVAERVRPAAIRNVKTGILLDLIAEKEGVTVSEEEIKTRITMLARHFQATPDAVVNFFITKDGSLANLERSIRDEKVMDLVLSKAEIVKGE